MQFKTFDYNNPIHQRIGVGMTVLYYVNGDWKFIYEDADQVEADDEDLNLYWQVWQEFIGPLPENYPMTSKETDKAIEGWLDKNVFMFSNIIYLSLNPTNALQTPRGETYWDASGKHKWRKA